MKNQAVHLKHVLLFFTALFWLASCSKKSDSPAPAATSGNSIASPNTTNKNPSDASSPTSTGRPVVTDINVSTTNTAGSAVNVSVVDPVQQRTTMADSNQTSLDKLLGVSTGQQLRTEGASQNKDFGWLLYDMTINGKAYNNQQIYDGGAQTITFFNIDSSGYYWQYNTKTKNWVWGTWAIDKSVKFLAFDFDKSGVPEQVWEITRISDDRMLIRSRFDFNGDGLVDDVILGLNGLDLTSTYFDGQIKLSQSEKLFVNNWTFIGYQGSAASGDTSYYADNSNSKLYIANSGIWETINGSTSAADYGSWMIESIQNQGSNVFYLYSLQYNSTGKIVLEFYVVAIQGQYMVGELVYTSDPDPVQQSQLYYRFYYQKN
jgi:hypothetical protein